MVAFKDRTGDFTKKKYLYKFYKNGYNSRRPKYMTAGQYMGGSGGFVNGNGYTNSGIYNSSGVFENNLSIDFAGSGSNASAGGVYRYSTDERRKLDIKDLIISFSHGYFASVYATVTDYTITLFDYEILRNVSANTIAFRYKGAVVNSVTYSASYAYLKLYEKNGIFYIERSADGVTWTAWTQHAVDFDSDIIKSTLSLDLSFSMAGPDRVAGFVSSIEAIDRKGQLLAVETRALNDLEFNETINTPASTTKIAFPYNPLSVPEHCAEGNFVEIYANFYDDGVIKYEPILDQNSANIQDQNSEPIYGVVLHGNIPEQASILKFSGYISLIDYDYDNETVALNFVSHGEATANSMIRDGYTSVPVLVQQSQNASESITNRRQTFTLTKMTKLDSIGVYLSYGGGGSAQAQIGRGNTTLAGSRSLVWSGGLGAGAYTLPLNEPLYLEAGTYWLRVSGLVNWHYQNTNVYDGGTRQQFAENQWQNVAGDAYFQLYSQQEQLAVNLSGDSYDIAHQIFEKSLDLDYSPLYLDEVEQTTYKMNVGLNMDNAKNGLNALYRQLPAGWYYTVDKGTGAVKIRNKNATPDHLFVFGRDFTEMLVTKDIDGIINDVYYLGSPLVENGPKLTVRSFDIDSIGEYRQGTTILSNEKVTRYDTAQLLSENVISNNNISRITTEIRVSAARYNTESVKIGHVVKIANGDQDVLRTTLVVADIKYSPSEITISLDSAPRNLSRTIDAINRQLENMQTANAGAVV